MYDNHRKEQQNPVKTPVQQSFGRTAKKTPALLGYPPSCRDCTRQFQLQLSAFPAGRFHLLRDLSACRFRSPAAVVRPPAWTAPASSSCSCPSAGRLRDSVAGRFHLLSGAVTRRLRLHSSFSYSSDLAAPIGFARLLRLPARKSSVGFGRLADLTAPAFPTGRFRPVSMETKSLPFCRNTV